MMLIEHYYTKVSSSWDLRDFLTRIKTKVTKQKFKNDIFGSNKKNISAIKAQIIVGIGKWKGKTK